VQDGQGGGGDVVSEVVEVWRDAGLFGRSRFGVSTWQVFALQVYVPVHQFGKLPCLI
jgi:hypothetical protein